MSGSKERQTLPSSRFMVPGLIWQSMQQIREAYRIELKIPPEHQDDLLVLLFIPAEGISDEQARSLLAFVVLDVASALCGAQQRGLIAKDDRGNWTTTAQAARLLTSLLPVAQRMNQQWRDTFLSESAGDHPETERQLDHFLELLQNSQQFQKK